MNRPTTVTATGNPTAAAAVPIIVPADVQTPQPADLPAVTPVAIASPDAEAEETPTAVAAVAPAYQPVFPDLVAPVAAATAAPPVATREYGPPAPPAGGSGADFDSLIDLITTTVEPDGWEDVGGPGTVSSFETGVRADPHGQFDQIARVDHDPSLQNLAAQSAPAAAPVEVTGGSSLRIVSLPRLERIVARYREADAPLPDDVRYLAGLTAVQYVFVYPEQGDVMIAGPAELWQLDDEGRALGVDSGRPVLQLDDLVTLLRVFAPSGNGSFGCSINPREANLKQLKQFVETSQANGPLRPGARNGWLRELRDHMGLQDVQIYGVPRASHVAQVIFDADYRMKLIGIGKLDGGPNVPSIFSLLRRNDDIQGVPLAALRWWLTMKYEAVLHSPQRDAFEIRGSSVLVQSENQFVTAQGRRIQTGKAEPINREFAENFTKHYAEIAEQYKVFTELKNLFDMAMAAAICQRDGLYESVGWDMGSFAPDGAHQVAQVETPTEIESVINHRVYGGRDIVVQVAGGVVGNVRKVVNDRSRQVESVDLVRPRELATLDAADSQHWWWDATP
ncbi:DUF1598 domain-containing protein [Symmachiella macrocystis]|nr:DUF1598 domain-containing protein [Symmachiella macrocystis]